MSNSNENETKSNSEQILQETAAENNSTLKKQKNFKKLPFITGGILITIIAILLILKYCLPAIDNTISSASPGEKEYYNKVEQNQLKQIAKTGKKSYEKYLKFLDFLSGGKMGQNIDIKISIDPSFSKTYFSLDKIEPIELKMLTMVNPEQSVNMDFKMFYNNKSLLTFHTLMDTLNAKLYLNIPELSKAYISGDLKNASTSLSEDDTSANGDDSSILSNKFLEDPASLYALETYLSSDDFFNLITKYGDIIINNTSNITLDKEQTITINGLSTPCSKLTVSYSSSECAKIMKKICSEIKQDQILRSLYIDWAGMPEDEYTDLLSEIVNSDDISTRNSSDDDLLTLYIWTDTSGNVIGREFRIKPSQDKEKATVYRYQKLKEDDNDGVLDFYIEDNTGSISLVITTTEKDGFLSGTANVQYKEEDNGNNYNILCDFKNFKIVDTEKELFTGTFNLSSPAFPGFQFVVDAKENQGTQNIAFDVLMANEKTITVNLSGGFTDYKDFSTPPEGTIYDESQSDEYFKSIDTIGFTTKIKDALGDDLFNLLVGNDGATS